MKIDWHQLFLDDLRSEGHISLQDVINRYDVSESTARRHITKLGEEGVIRRVKGGAVWLEMHPSMHPFHVRAQKNHEAKEAIARKAVTLVKPGMSIIIGGGTTAYTVAKQLKGMGMRVVTNSLPVMDLFVDDETTQLTALGGQLYHNGALFHGYSTMEQLARLRVDMAFMSTGGFSHEGFFHRVPAVIELDRKIAEISKTVVVAAVSDKYGEESFSLVLRPEEVDILLTDRPIPDLPDDLIKVIAATE
ncbi:MAG: DeoR/GlpR transcriptional regulator [Planctomycetes bacterium]|nr:DeoR/GlpR transcriptional regulator [Planctomycetota bacterium]